MIRSSTWSGDAPAVVLDARPYGEGNALVTVLTEAHGAHPRTRARRWVAGAGIVVAGGQPWCRRAGWRGCQTSSARSLRSWCIQRRRWRWRMGWCLPCCPPACAVAEGALPEREPHPLVFAGLLQMIAGLSAEAVAALVRWETVVLAELGYGLDLASCTITGETAGLAYVSPRTGRAVSRDAAGVWHDRLLRLPGFLVGGNASSPADWRDGLMLTGPFPGAGCLWSPASPHAGGAAHAV